MNEAETTAFLSRLSFEEIYDQYATDILRVAHFYLKDQQKAEDVCQETFVKLISKNPNIEAGKEKTWLLKVAINQCRDMLKSSWNKRIELGDEQLSNIPAPSNENSELHEELIIAIQKLPAKFKEIIILYYYKGYGIAEISHILSISIGTVSSRMARARAKLHEMLGGKEQ